MKKQYFIYSVITCMVIFNVNAQNMPTEVTLTSGNPTAIWDPSTAKTSYSAEEISVKFPASSQNRITLAEKNDNAQNTPTEVTLTGGNPTAIWDPSTAKMSYSAEKISVKFPASSQNRITLAENNDNAQQTPIDDLLKKYPSMEGITHVSMSQQMLQTIFGSPIPIRIPYGKDSIIMYEIMDTPEAYSSVSISKTVNASNIFADFKKMLLSAKYEQIMEMNKENSDLLCYYMKKVTDKTNEIVVLRQQKNQFSAIYIKGDFEIKQLDNYLQTIKSSLDRQMGANNTGIFQSGDMFAFSMPSFDNLKYSNFQKSNFKFDSDSLKSFMMDAFLKYKVEKWMTQKEDFIRFMEEAREN